MIFVSYFVVAALLLVVGVRDNNSLNGKHQRQKPGLGWIGVPIFSTYDVNFWFRSNPD